jgi:hypothetical protein
MIPAAITKPPATAITIDSATAATAFIERAELLTGGTIWSLPWLTTQSRGNAGDDFLKGLVHALRGTSAKDGLKWSMPR